MSKRYRREHIVRSVQAMREQNRQDWRHYPTVLRYLEKFHPELRKKVGNCCMAPPKLYRTETRAGEFVKYGPKRCNIMPYCIPCVRARSAARVHGTFEKFQRCTPAGKPMRLRHIIQTAPIYHPGHPKYRDGAPGWGVKASEDLTAFFQIVDKTLKEFFGDGIGWIGSYQDFGEQGFRKRHPHIDLTLNGWMLQDGEAVKTPTMDLKSKGRARWDEAIQERAMALDIEAGRGNVLFLPWKQGRREYYRVLKYQMREMVDLRKMVYNGPKRTVYWRDYKTGRAGSAMLDLAFKEALQEYRTRLGAWQKGGPELHRAYGHLNRKCLRKTQAIMGGAPTPHGRACPCSQCGDWDRVFPDDLDLRLGAGKPV